MEYLVTQFGAEETEANSGFGALGIDATAFVIQLITFLLVFFIFKKYVFGRIVKLLEDRRKKIEQGVKLTNEMTVARKRLEEEITKQRKEARKEADQIISDSHEQAGAILKDAEDTAQRKIDSLIADAHKRIEDETNRARRELENELVDIVIQATEKICNEKLDTKKDAQIIEEALRSNS